MDALIAQGADTLQIRVKAAGATGPSTWVNLLAITQGTTPNFTIDYAAEKTVEAVGTGVEYNTDNDFTTANTDGVGATVSLTPGTDAYFRVKGNGSVLPSSVQTLVVAARQTTPNFTIDYAAEKTAESVGTGVEYNTDNDFSTANTDGTGAAITLTPGTDVYFRVKSTSTSFASEVQTLVVAARPTTPNFTIDYAAEKTAESVGTGVEYNTDNDFSTANTDGTGATITLTPGTDVYFRVKYTSTSFASAVQQLVVAARPALGNIAASDQTSTATIQLDGVNLTTSDGYEYSQNSGAWTAILTGDTFDLTGDTTYIVRKAATSTSFSSANSNDLDTP
jgi:hypothetical protein